MPELDPSRAVTAVSLAQRLRQERLSKTPGVAETLDFAAALETLGLEDVDAHALRDALGTLIKDPQDLAELTPDRLESLLAPTAPDGPTPTGE